jgi:hypothetical protein
VCAIRIVFESVKICYGDRGSNSLMRAIKKRPRDCVCVCVCARSERGLGMVCVCVCARSETDPGRLECIGVCAIQN